MTSHTNHNNLFHQHKQGIINSLKYFLLWTGGSVLAVSLGFILRIRAGLDGWLEVFFIRAIPYMLVIIIIQSTIMTGFLSHLKKRNPDRMPRLYRLSCTYLPLSPMLCGLPAILVTKTRYGTPLMGDSPA